jgi:hypothetical protein
VLVPTARPRPRRPSLLALVIGVGLMVRPALAPATIEQQRERLPPPAFDCADDPIAGVWQAHVFYAHVNQWYLFRLDIARDGDDPSGEGLRGTIEVEFWDDDGTRSQPPACNEPGNRAGVFEHAIGHARALELSFSATDWRDTQVCGPAYLNYLLDNFSGTVDPERMEFQSLLNADAPEWRDVPTVFRRVRCPAPAEPSEPKITVVPPPFQPPASNEGCGLWSGK